MNVIIKRHKVILVEDSAESIRGTYKGAQTRRFGIIIRFLLFKIKLVTGSQKHAA